MDIEKLRSLKNYPTKTGRKHNDIKVGRKMMVLDQITLAEAAKILGIEPFKVPKLIRRGILERLNRLGRYVYVSRKAVIQLRRKLNDKNMILVEDAAERFGIPIKIMEGKWIRTGVLKIHDFGLWRKIRISNLQTLEGLLATHVTSKEAGDILSMHRSYLPNLERRGVIMSKRIGKNGSVRLYARADLIKIKHVLVEHVNCYPI